MGVSDLAQLAAALGGGALLPSAAKFIWRWIGNSAERELSRIESLEELVDVLRRVLDKGRLREDALAQVLGVLIFALKHIEDPPPAIANAIDRAVEILERAQIQLQHINDGGQS